MKRLTDAEWKARGGWDPSVDILSPYKGNRNKLRVSCKQCGRAWGALPGNLLAGKSCRVCSRAKAGKTLRQTKRNKIERTRGGNLDVNIATRRYPDAVMIIDREGWEKIKRLNSRVSRFGNYAALYVAGKVKLIHRLLIPGSPHVDHINGNGLDNRAENLRPCSPSENGRNRNKLNVNNTSGVRGVNFRKDTGKWSAQLMLNGINVSLGCFPTKKEAEAARLAAERDMFKEFAPRSGGTKRD